MTAEALADLLHARRAGPGRWMALCPVHGDRTPSLSIREGRDGRVLLFCHARCAIGDVLATLGLTERDLFADTPFDATAWENAHAGQPVREWPRSAREEGSKAPASPRGCLEATYEYRTSLGVVAFEKRRYRDADGRKTFRLYRPEGLRGWAAGIGEQRRVLYRLPELVAANVVLLCEGEKDCATLDALALGKDLAEVRAAATTNFEGAWQPGQSPKWRPEYSPYFAGKCVFVFEDNDAAGRAWSSHVASQVYPFAAWVRIISLPGLPEKGDVTDWLESHTREELLAHLKTAPHFLPAGEPVAPHTKESPVASGALMKESLGMGPAKPNYTVISEPKERTAENSEWAEPPERRPPDTARAGTRSAARYRGRCGQGYRAAQ